MLVYFIVFGLVAGLGIIFAMSDRQSVMANWDSQRCGLPVIVAANMYKPANDQRSDFEFAQENFEFCVQQMIKDVFAVALAPFLTLVQSQMSAASVVQEVQNTMRSMLGNFQRVFSDLIDGVFQRFMAVGFQIRMVYTEFLAAMQKAFAIAASSVFMGISMVVGIENSYKFITKVVLIILGILVGLVIILFLVLIPVLPVIFTTITVLAAAGLGSVDAGAFCFAPRTPIQLQNGTYTEIGSLHVGDILHDGTKVEGILCVSGKGAPLYQLSGIQVSGDHLVWYDTLKEWILVSEHPLSRPIVKREEVLICLNTDRHTIPVGSHLFRDWEEMPEESPETQAAWGRLIAEMLKTPHSTYADAYCILDPIWKVYKEDTGFIPLSSVEIGHKIRDMDGTFTTVLGIYRGQEDVVFEKSGQYWYSDSVWWNTSTGWSQKPLKGYKITSYGYQLITESGRFQISDGVKIYGVRDFTEVGWNRLSETYEWMKKTIS